MVKKKLFCVQPLRKKFFAFDKVCKKWMFGLGVGKQEIVFKKDKATLHVISKRCEDTKHF